MKKVFIFISFLSLLLYSAVSFSDESPGEYRIKAAFLHKFFFFVKWPEKTFDESEATITIGVLGEDPFGDIFKSVESESIGGRRLIVKKLKEDVSPETLRGCHILFIKRSLEKRTTLILTSLNNYPVLTVSETETFTPTLHKSLAQKRYARSIYGHQETLCHFQDCHPMFNTLSPLKMS